MTSTMADVLTLAFPLLATFGVAITFLVILRIRDRELEVFELGVFFAGIVLLYSVYAPLAYLAGGMRFSQFTNVLLFLAKPLPQDMARMSWYFFAYFISFVSLYLLVRGKSKIEIMRIPRPDRRMLMVLVLFYIGIKAFVVFIKVYYKIPQPESYTSSFLLYTHLPVILQQSIGHLEGIELTVDVVLMAFLTMYHRKYKLFIFGWIILEFLALYFYDIGARTGLFTVVVSLLITYHYAVKRVILRSVLLLGVACIVLFNLFGILRDYPTNNVRLPANPLLYPSEFDNLYGNALILQQYGSAGPTSGITFWIYAGDFLNVIPQQLLPVRKVDPLDWYANTFFPQVAATGSGFCFGAIAEAIVGLGWFDAVWRGAILGVIFGLIHRNFVRGKRSFWKYCFYVWTVVFCYLSFRSTTFRLLPYVIYNFLGTYAVVQFMLFLFPAQRKIRSTLQPLPGFE